MKRIRFCGTGGQGVLLDGIIMANAFVMDNKFACQTASYGSQVRGMITTADVIADDDLFDFPGFDEADILVAFSQEAYDNYARKITKNGLIFYDATLVTLSLDEKSHNHRIPANKMALEQFKSEMMSNMIMLGFVWQKWNFVPKKILVEAIKENVSNKYIDINSEALNCGIDFSS